MLQKHKNNYIHAYSITTDGAAPQSLLRKQIRFKKKYKINAAYIKAETS